MRDPEVGKKGTRRVWGRSSVKINLFYGRRIFYRSEGSRALRVVSGKTGRRTRR